MCWVSYRRYLYYFCVVMETKDITDMNPECIKTKDGYWTFEICLWVKFAVKDNDEKTYGIIVWQKSIDSRW